MGKRRIRTWLLHLFTRKPPEEPFSPLVPHPTPGEIAAVRRAIPERRGNRTPSEAELYALFRLGWSGGREVGFQEGRNSVLVAAIHTQHSLPALPAAVRAPLRDAPLHDMLAAIAPTPPPPKPRQFQTRVLPPLPPLEEEDQGIEFWEDHFLLDMTDITAKREAV